MLALILELSLDEAKFVLAALRVQARSHVPMKSADTRIYGLTEVQIALTKAANQLDAQIYGGGTVTR